METKGKAKVKERKDNVSTKSQNFPKNSGQADPANSGQINPGKLTPTVRTGENMTGTQLTRVLKHQQQLKKFNMLRSVNGDFRILVLPITSNFLQLDRLDPSQRIITFGIDTAACQNCCSCPSPHGPWFPRQAEGIYLQTDSLASTRTKISDELPDVSQQKLGSFPH